MIILHVIIAAVRLNKSMLVSYIQFMFCQCISLCKHSVPEMPRICISPLCLGVTSMIYGYSCLSVHAWLRTSPPLEKMYTPFWIPCPQKSEHDILNNLNGNYTLKLWTWKKVYTCTCITKKVTLHRHYCFTKIYTRGSCWHHIFYSCHRQNGTILGI